MCVFNAVFSRLKTHWSAHW